MPSATTARRRQPCVKCGRKACATETLGFRDTVVRISCCESDLHDLTSIVYGWTRFTSNGTCGSCGRLAENEPEEIRFRNERRFARYCMQCVARYETDMYKWIRLGETVVQADDLSLRAERANVVKLHQRVVPEKLEKPAGVDDQQDQEQLNKVWREWQWKKHSIERLIERGLTKIDGFDVRDVIAAIAFGTQLEEKASRLAAEIGLDLGLHTRKRYMGERCVVVGDYATKEIITAWGREQETGIRKGA